MHHKEQNFAIAAQKKFYFKAPHHIILPDLGFSAQLNYSAFMRATRAFIYQDHLRFNLSLIRQKYPRTPICLCVKADAYGHGLGEIAQYASDFGIDALAVAVVEEGATLRKTGIRVPIFVLGPFPKEDCSLLVSNNLIPLIASKNTLNGLALESRRQSKTTSIHIKIDTGMSRFGCNHEDTADLVAEALRHPELSLEGLCTHFASSDEEDPKFTRIQLEQFLSVSLPIQQRIGKKLMLHAANSGAILNHPDTVLDMVRPGIMAYGYGHPDLKPVMELRSQVMMTRTVGPDTPVSYGSTYRTKAKTTLALIPAGYADGFCRALSNQGQVFINEALYPIAGRICMDQFVVDLGENTPVKEGDEVILFGPFTPALTAETLAGLCGTISYEILCGISKRVPRIYL